MSDVSSFRYPVQGERGRPVIPSTLLTGQEIVKLTARFFSGADGSVPGLANALSQRAGVRMWRLRKVTEAESQREQAPTQRDSHTLMSLQAFRARKAGVMHLART